MIDIEEIKENFAKNMRTARKNMGLSQLELYKLTGIDPNKISNYECTYCMPTTSTLCKLADALRVTETELLHGTVEVRR